MVLSLLGCKGPSITLCRSLLMTSPHSENHPALCLFLSRRKFPHLAWDDLVSKIPTLFKTFFHSSLLSQARGLFSASLLITLSPFNPGQPEHHRGTGTEPELCFLLCTPFLITAESNLPFFSLWIFSWHMHSDGKLCEWQQLICSPSWWLYLRLLFLCALYFLFHLPFITQSIL